MNDEHFMRRARNDLLLACDWTQIQDAQLTPERKAEWAEYRQQLRDLPSNPEFPVCPWPVMPGGRVNPEDKIEPIVGDSYGGP